MLRGLIVLLRHFTQLKAVGAILFLAVALVSTAARADDKNKEKPEKEKKVKIEPWVEIRTAHFIVASDGGEKSARKFGDEFESLLRIFQSTMPKARVTTGIPVRILVARNGESFGRVAPEFPYNKNRDQPPGTFVDTTEKSFIVIRGNASGRFAFAEIFQNYAKQVLKSSYRSLPPWLEEGYSTVYSNLTFTDRGPRLERPDPNDLSILTESPLLPLNFVLGADRTSPYYSPGNKDSVYFAESRVLLHFLITDPQFAGSSMLSDYIAAVESGTDLLKAARTAFGDLNQLQARLDTYVKDVSGPAVDLPAGAGSESTGAPRTLSPAEAEARLGDYLSLGRRSAYAEDKLNEALMNEPSLAEAEQSLGFLTLKRGDLDEAEKHFEKAAQLDPSDALNFYGEGLVAMGDGGKAAFPPSAAVAFEKAVALNAEFAPAWFNLATIYAQSEQTRAKALADAQRAAALVPGDGSYQLQVAALLNETGHSDEARKTASRVKETSTDRATADKAGDLVAKMSRPQPSQSAPPNGQVSPRTPPPPPSGAGGLKIENKTDTSAAPATAQSKTTAPASPTVSNSPPATSQKPVPPLFGDSVPNYSASTSNNAAVASNRVYSMLGTITEVNCASAPQIQITLKSQTITMKLHADNLGKVPITAAGSATAPKVANCASFRGRSVRVSYLLVAQKAWDGEMQEVEFRSQP